MNVKNMMEIIYASQDQEKVVRANRLLEKLLSDLKCDNPIEYKQFTSCLYKITYGGHLNEDLAMAWVSEMRNKDGTKGQHWSLQDTENLRVSRNLPYDTYDFYAVMNMMHSDYYNTNFSTEDYLGMCQDWLNDIDVSKDKTVDYCLWIAMK